jgi:hypothetical protein
VPPTLTRRRGERAVGALIALQLLVAVPAVFIVDGDKAARKAPVAINHNDAIRDAALARTAAIKALMARRAHAVLTRDRVEFLADLDPRQARFRTRQAQVFDNMKSVPFASWTYVIDADRERAHTPALDAARGTWWSPTVTLRFAIKGYDRVPTEEPQGLTFTQRAGRWYLAADADFLRSGHPTQREIWDGGPVRVLRGTSCIVLSHSRGSALAGQVRGECDAAIPKVTAVWGTGWLRKVVLVVPDTSKELKAIISDVGDVSNIAAVATAELVDPATGYHPVGDRVVVNPDTFGQLGALGRKVVLTHEVTHVASRAATGPNVPTWMVEGLADYVGFLQTDLPLSVTASELQATMRKGKVPDELPLDSEFAGGRADLAETYEMSWLAVKLIVKKYGQARMLKLYRDIGANESGSAVELAFAQDLKTTVTSFTRTWHADLIRQLL